MQFKKYSIVVRDDSTHPEGALVVDGLAASGDLLAHPLGGGLQVIIPAAEMRRFSVASELERTPLFHRAHFEIEGVNEKFAGWSDGRVGNGWAMPYFEFPEAGRVIANVAPETGRYDAALNAFVTVSDDEDETWSAEIIALPDGGTVKAYPLGAGSWIWDEEESA